MIYLDSCLVIYAIEPNGTASERVLAAIADADATFAVSPLVLMECLVGPLRAERTSVAETYEAFCSSVEMIPLGLDVFRRAAELRATTSLRTPDALHLAAADLGGCSALWTNDHRFAAVGEFVVNVLS